MANILNRSQYVVSVAKRDDLTSPRHAGLPATGTAAQVLLALSCRWVRDFHSLQQLVEWLEQKASGGFRADFDSVLAWPLVQTAGAFVQGAWAAVHESVSDWQPWLDLFDRIDSYARRHGSPNFGREAAKAKARGWTPHAFSGW